LQFISLYITAMQKSLHFLWLLLLLFLAPALVLPTTVSAQPKILVLHANPSDRAADVQAKLQATGYFSTVDLWDMDNATGLGTVPTLANLQAYDAIITFTNYGPLTGVGDVVAQYIEGGGGVVNGVFSIINDYRGLYASTTYEALVPGNAISGTELTLGTVPLPLHPIMAGVSSFDGGTSSFKSDATTVEPGAYVVANWSDGTPLIVAKENVGAKNAKIVDLNFFLPSTDVPTKTNYWVASTDGAKIMANALLWVIPPPPAELAVTPHALNFGTLFSGQSDTVCVTVSDVGPNKANATPLTISSVTFSGVSDYSIVSGVSGSLTPGQSGSICVRFSPLANGGRGASMTIVSNGKDSGTQYVSLTGQGITPQVSFSQTRLFNRTTGKIGHCATQAVLVSSTGAGPLNISSVTFGGYYPGEYSVSRLPLNPLPAGTTDSLIISYCPTLEGTHTAFLVINSNAVNLPHDTIQLGGIGILPRLVVAPQPLNFDSVALGTTQVDSIMLWNPGTDTITILQNFFSSADGDFKLAALPPNTMIPPDGRVYVQISFAPQQNGIREARYRITTNIPMTFDSPARDTSSFYVNIIGEGVPFGVLSVRGTPVTDSEIVGQQLCTTDTLFNNGSAPLTITQYTLTGANASEYSLSGLTMPITIPSGGKYVFNVCITPTARGDRNATLNLTNTTNGRTTTAQLPLDVFGQAVCASVNSNATGFPAKTCVGSTDTAWVTITNCGDAMTTYTSSLSTSATAYQIIGAKTSAPISATGTSKIGILFTPTATGAAAGTLTITGTGGITETVNLDGTGGAASITGAGTAALTQIGTSTSFAATVTNAGLCDWSPGAPTIAGANAADFTCTGNTTKVIPAGGSDTLTFSYHPTTAGTSSAVASFPTESEASLPTPASVTLSGSAQTEGVAYHAEANGFVLAQNYPNPFNPMTEIRFTLPEDSHVQLDIVDMTGRIVRNVLSERMTAGNHGTVIDASELASGVYFYQLTAGSVKLTRQMMLTK
jgi:hypothetical protein